MGNTSEAPSFNKTLVIYAHAAPSHSRVNQRLYKAIQPLPGVVIHDLYTLYPDFDIDIRYEQAALLRAQRIVLQYPLQWYGVPALLKEWLDTVLSYGWAYGHEEAALQGKECFIVVSTGGVAAEYAVNKRHGAPLQTYLYGMEQIVRYCHMQWLPPLILHGADTVEEADFLVHQAQYLARLHERKE
jgi:glutathione-regulated potassium-efflux system ancillary protein KefF